MDIRTHIITKFTEITKNEEESKVMEDNTFTFVSQHCKNNNIPQMIKNIMFKQKEIRI